MVLAVVLAHTLREEFEGFLIYNMRRGHHRVHYRSRERGAVTNVHGHSSRGAHSTSRSLGVGEGQD